MFTSYLGTLNAAMWIQNIHHLKGSDFFFLCFSNWCGTYLELPGLGERKVCIELLFFRTSASLADFQVLEITDILILVR